MRFTHVRVPLDRMLMGVATVSETGEYKRVPGGDKRSYGSMLDVRANLVSTTALHYFIFQHCQCVVVYIAAVIKVLVVITRYYFNVSSSTFTALV
jgi:hypothetical protein